MGFIHTIKNYLATKRNELLIHATIWISFEIIRWHNVWFHLYEVHRIGNSTEKESRSAVA